VLAVAVGFSLAAASVFAAQKRVPAPKVPAGKRERIDCMVGTEDRQARIAIEVLGGKVQNFAYYGKTKPRTCSMDVKRSNSYSKWEDKGPATIVTLVDGTGDFLIDHQSTGYRFIFREIDRMRYCGMSGKINGSLSVVRKGASYACTVERLFIEAEVQEEPDKTEEPEKKGDLEKNGEPGKTAELDRNREPEKKEN